MKNLVLVGFMGSGKTSAGKLAAEIFAREGASIVVTDIADEEGEEVARSIRDGGGKAIFVHADVSKEDDVKHMVAAAIAAFDHVDILYNNAGIMPADDAGVIDLTEASWDRILDINLKSAFLCTKYAVPHMIERGPGCLHCLQRGHAFTYQVFRGTIWEEWHSL